MDFFASQELARRNTRKLVVLLAITLIAIVGSVYVVVLLALGLLGNNHEIGGQWARNPAIYIQALLWTIVAVGAIVGIGSVTKVMELRSGGQAIAHMMRGRRLQPNTSDLAERRILNVVEEMALAAGVPVPPVYLLDHENGINAFAAGYTVDDAIIGVNRGTLDILNRDELQGVMAHEFSHILNGDMRMSLRLIGILHGVQVIALIGYFLIRIIGSGSRQRSSRNDSKGDPTIFLLVLGVGLLAVGSVGLFFAKIIKASISRQREYLADASSVQFTRNPGAIAGALKMIAINHDTSLVKSAHAEEISHMFFANLNGSLFSSLLSTHPALPKRIKAIEPGFDNNYEGYYKSRAKTSIGSAVQPTPSETKGKRGLFPFGTSAGIPGSSGIEFGAMTGVIAGFDPQTVISGIGVPTDDDVIYSQMLIGNIPRRLLEAARDLYSARCLVYASLLDAEIEIRKLQIDLLYERTDSGTVNEIKDLWPMITRIDQRFRMPVFEILQGTLVGLSAQQYLAFRRTLTALIDADKKISLFEFFLRQHLVVHLDRHFGHGLPHLTKFNSVKDVQTAIEVTLSVLANVGHEIGDEIQAAFDKGAQQFATSFNPSYRNGPINFAVLATAVDDLSHATPAIKKSVLTAAAVTISFDHVVTVEEAEMFRAFSESLDCPVPPLLATLDS